MDDAQIKEELAIRLQDNGIYVDSEICWQALEKLKKQSQI